MKHLALGQLLAGISTHLVIKLLKLLFSAKWVLMPGFSQELITRIKSLGLKNSQWK